jgi:solute:Na+ symporter, SSS family
MQRVLATRDSREASLMSAMVNVALYFPRYMMVAGLTILALVPLQPTLLAEPGKVDFEQILPMVIRDILPIGLTGLLLAGLLAAFMSTFAATVNAGPAYIVNDIYRRFINPNASDKTQIRMSYVASILVVVVGILFGFLTESITEITMWIVGALYGGYVAANVLKWHWWRFNGYGYFWGMIAGTIGAMVVPYVWERLYPETNTLYAFPAILVLSIVGCFVGTLLTSPEDDEVLMTFYRNVRPWGFWGPVREMVLKRDPQFEPNRNFRNNMFNVAVGIVWQLTLTVLPVYIVIREWEWAVGTLCVLVITSSVLKFTWYDKLSEAHLSRVELAYGADDDK